MPSLRRVGQRHPQAGERDHEADRDEEPSCPAMPAGVPASQPGGELESPEDDVRHGGDDVPDQRHRRGGEASIGREDLGSPEDLDEAAGSAEDRDDGQRQQGRRDPPARWGRAHSTPAVVGSGVLLTEGDGVSVAARVTVQSDQPSAIMAMPFGKASSR